MAKQFKQIVSIGDQHLPFLNKPCWAWIVKAIQCIRPPYITFGGDLYDMYAFSKFTKRIRFTPKEEIESARRCAEEMMHMVRKAAPDAHIFVLKGNHDIRGAMRMAEKFDSAWEALAMPKDLWAFDGIETINDPKEVLRIQDINFTHGYKSKPGDHMKDMEFSHTCVHHTHRGGVFAYRLHSGEIRYELNPGYIADPFSPELNYRPLNKYFAWTAGFGMWDAWGPRFMGFPHGRS
jgi:hypothetical protein